MADLGLELYSFDPEYEGTYDEEGTETDPVTIVDQKSDTTTTTTVTDDDEPTTRDNDTLPPSPPLTTPSPNEVKETGEKSEEEEPEKTDKTEEDEEEEEEEESVLPHSPPPSPPHPLDPSELPLPPLPEEEAPEEEFSNEVRYKYPEDSGFVNLHQLSPLEKIFLCVSANASSRRIWICNQLPLLLDELTSEEGLAYVFPLMLRLCQDDVPAVREALVENLDRLLLFYTQHPNVSTDGSRLKIDPESFVQLLSVSLFSLKPSLGSIADDAILRFCRALPTTTLETDLLPLFIRLLAEPEEYVDEDSFDPAQYIQQSPTQIKLKVFGLLSQICPQLQEQTLVEVILPLIENDATHDAFEIRKELLRMLGGLFKLLPSSTLLHRLYPLYIEFAQDSVYEVRQLACEILVDLTELLISVAKSQDGIEWMERFLNDSSHKVKTTACHLLGRFLYLFHGSEIPDSLLKKYFVNCKSSKSEIRTSCAYHLPAIVLLLKSSGWHQIKPLFNHLAKDKEIETQHSLAASIHELAKLLTPEQTSSDLVPVFRTFISASSHASVQLAALRNVSSFLIYVSVTERSSLLPGLLEAFQSCLLDPVTQIRSWRSREPYIQQLGSLLELADLTEGIRYVFPLLLSIARSQVPAIVRAWTVEALPSFYHAINSNRCVDTGLMIELFDQFDILLRSSNFRDRLLYVLICRRMLEDTQHANFDHFFLPNLSTLVVDKVLDVRLAVAKLLRDICTAAPSALPPSLDAAVPTPAPATCLPPTPSEVRQLLTRELISRFQPEDHHELQSIVDSLTTHVTTSLTLTS